MHTIDLAVLWLLLCAHRHVVTSSICTSASTIASLQGSGVAGSLRSGVAPCNAHAHLSGCLGVMDPLPGHRHRRRHHTAPRW